MTTTWATTSTTRECVNCGEDKDIITLDEDTCDDCLEAIKVSHELGLED